MIFARTMTFMDAGTIGRFEGFLARIGEILGNDERRASFATYAMGILSDAERKSAEPLAARACAAPGRADAEHQRLLHFLADSKWKDEAVRRESARYGVASMTAREPVEAWILDDTGFLKQGKHSVGVQRQYTGSAGKVTNCQIGVSLTVATRTEHLPIDFELYLPGSWVNAPARRKEGRIPDDVAFKTKPQLGLQMVARALKAGVPKGAMLADAGYGSSKDFRAGLRQLELAYAVGVNSTTKVRLLGKDGIHHGKSQSLKKLGRSSRRRAHSAAAPGDKEQRDRSRPDLRSAKSRFPPRRPQRCSSNGVIENPSPPTTSSYRCTQPSRRSSWSG